MTAQYAFVMKNVTRTFPGQRTVLKDISLSFYPGAKIGVIGHNGSGKSTLLKIMAGLDTEFSGEAWPGKGIKVGYLAQEPKLDPTKNVWDNIMEGVAEKKELLDKYNAISLKFAEPMSDDEMTALIEEQGNLQEEIDRLNLWELDHEVSTAMRALSCPPKDAAIDKLSGGEKRRVALCRLLLERPDMLLLDEPTNHLDAHSVAWLEHFLENYKGTVVMITHDRYFLDNVTGWILELDRGEGIPWEGNYTSWLEQKEKRLRVEEKTEAQRQKQLAKELEWVRQSPKARHAKSKARVQAYEDLLHKVQEKRVGVAQIFIPEGERLGSKVIEVNGLTKAYGDRSLMKDLEFKIPRGAIVGIIGPNGMGKSTFFRMVTGQEAPDAGNVDIGETVQLGFVDQSRDSLANEKTVWEEISDGQDEVQLGNQTMNSRAYCGAFNFKGPDQQKQVGNLSGGERNRVHLAKMIKQGSNVLLLDEPTNDLDVDTLRALEEAIEDFAGCVLIISHDRWFLNRLATHILAFEGDGNVVWFEGNYEDYDQDRKARGVQDVDKKKIKHQAAI